MLTSELDVRPSPRPRPGEEEGVGEDRPRHEPSERRRADPSPPLPPFRRPSVLKRVAGAFSVVLWVLATLGKAVAETVQQFVVGFVRTVAEAVSAPNRDLPSRAQPRVTSRSAQPRAGSRSKEARTPPRRGRSAAIAVLVAAALVAVLSGPGLNLAARPLASSLASKGLPPLEQPSNVLAADGTNLAVLHDGINRTVVPLSEIPDVMLQAVIAAEDKSFWAHRGYDRSAMVRALLANLQAREVTQGASTISQQVAKQNLVGGDHSVLRKAKELLHAVALERHFTKEQLMERYLNQVYLGSQAYGVAAAADEFFGVDVKDVSLEQAALLAGLIRAPAALDPRTDPVSATARRNQVLRAMTGERFISDEVAQEAMAKPVEVLPARPAEVSDRFVVEAVKREFLANPTFGETEVERRHLLLTGGLQIRTTVDPHLQATARRALSYISDDLGSALVALDPRSGAILAIHDSGQAGSSDFDVATQGRRAPGSTFKPLAAAAALEAGMPQSQFLVGDGPIELTYRGAPQPWPVDNFNGDRYGPVLLRDAVIKSINTAFAQVGVAVGPEKIADVARRLGIDVERAMGPPETRGPAVALGGLSNGVSPLEMASAYGAVASGGAHTAPHVIAQVTGPDGKERYRAQPNPQPALNPAVNGILVEILQDAIAQGTGSLATLPGWAPIGKTGTSEEGADAWFVGAVPVLSAAVWVGHPGSTQPAGLTGGRVAAPVWREFMSAALRGTPPVSFPTRTADRPLVRPLDLPVARPCTGACAAALKQR